MRYLFFIFFAFLFWGCSKTDERAASIDQLNFGKSKWYSKFLWVEKDTSILEKELKINFNEYAKREQAYVTLIIVDENKEPFCGKGKFVDFFFNDIYCNNGELKITSENIPENGIIRLGLKFHPEAKQGNHNGFISVVNHNIDRVGNFDINTDPRVLKWKAEFKKVMNPLLVILFGILASLLVLLLLWFLIFKRIQFPPIKTPKIQITEPYFAGLKTKGTRQIVFTSKEYNQGFFDRLFKGTVIYSKNNCWTKEVYVSPGRKKAQLKIKIPIGYQFKTLPDKKQASFYLERFKEYQIITDKKEIIQIKIL
ncbi:MAG: hypothetical protein K0B11_06150 [Mariniphaga sp.]|nr:hypothetical protein [Mariniphaga sp.]